MMKRQRTWSGIVVLVLALVSALSSGCLLLAETPDVWACDTSSDCEASEHCLASKCVPASVCVASPDCPDGSVCDAGRCIVGTPAECFVDDLVTCSPYRCGPNSTCLHSCGNSQSCLPGYFCQSGSCVDMAAECSVASAPSVCAGYACANGKCEADCSASGSCATGYACIAEECLPLRAVGQSCELADECASAVCCPNGPSDRRCVTACESVKPGEFCTFDGECLSGTCSAGSCAPCSTPACAAEVCAGIECGMFQGTYCGECTGRAYCSGSACIPACVSMECGTDNGVDCGTCADGEICSAGTCFEEVCSVDQQYYCDGDALMVCDDGLSFYNVSFCDGNEYCRDGEMACQLFVCQPNRGFCEGSVFVPCNVDGRPVTSEERDCELDGATCASDGCLELTVDAADAPDAAEVQNQGVCGNVYFVEEGARLVGMTQSMAPSAPPEVWWFVYRGDDPLGPFDQVIPRVTGSAQWTGGGYTSPELDVLLAGGSYYFMGLAANASVFVLDPGATTPQDVSFGTLESGLCSPQGLPQQITEVTDLGVAPQTITTRAM